MGQKSRILFAIVIALTVGTVTSITLAFADEDKNSSNPLNMIFSFFQELKYGLIPDKMPSLTPEINSAAIIFQLKDEVEDLKSRLNSLENPAKKYDGEMVEQSVCGVINQDVFNFSFQDEKTGKIKLLEDLHGFIMKCDQGPIDSHSVLKYTIINT